MADKRISQLVERVNIANNDVLPIVASGATTTNKVTVSTLQDWMQSNLDVGVTSVGITIGSTGTDVSVSGSPVTSSGNITINLPTASATNRGLLSAADWTTFNNKANAGDYVTLATTQTITAQKTFTTSGSSDTMIISHGSGSGFALDVLKAGNGEAIRVTKSSGTGNAMTISGGNFEAGTIVKTGGTSSQFLKADGSVDSNTYLTTGSAGSTYVPYSGAAASVNLGVYSITANAINSAGSGSTAGQINLRSDAFFSLVNGYGSIASGTTNQFNFYQTTGAGVFRGAILSLNSITASATRTYTLPDASGTLALSTDLGAYLPLAGGTLTGALNGTSASFTGDITTNGTCYISPASGNALNVISRTSTANGAGLSLRTNTTTNWLVGTAWGETSSNFVLYNAGTGTQSLKLDYSTNAATFSSSVTANGLQAKGSTLNNGNSVKFLRADNTEMGYIGWSNENTNNSTWLFKSSNGNPIAFSADATNQQLVLTTSGNVGIGTASPGSLFSIEKSSNSGSGSTFPRMSIKNTLATQGDGSSTFNFADILISSGNESVNMFLSTTYAAGSWSPAGIINVATNHDLQIKTNNLERMRITSGGKLLINTDTSGNGNLIVSDNNNSGITLRRGTTADRLFFFIGASSPYIVDDPYIESSNADIHIRAGSTGGVKLSIGATSFVSDSDIRLKDKIGDIDNALVSILKLETLKFNWKYDSELENKKAYFGLNAQNVQEILPELIDVGRDEMQTLGVKYTEIIPVLVKAIQELKTEIDSLKNQMQ